MQQLGIWKYIFTKQGFSPAWMGNNQAGIQTPRFEFKHGVHACFASDGFGFKIDQVRVHALGVSSFGFVCKLLDPRYGVAMDTQGNHFMAKTCEKLAEVNKLSGKILVNKQDLMLCFHRGRTKGKSLPWYQDRLKKLLQH